jgi:hypothetical protein
MRSLGASGQLRLQFASSLIEDRNDRHVNIIDQKRGQVLRSVGAVLSLVKDIEGVNIEIRNKLTFPQWEEGWCWYTLVITKNA